MNDFIAWLSELISRFSGMAYLLTGLAALFESSPVIGLFTPGVIVMVIAGFAAAEGLLDLSTLIIIALLGALAGEFLSYYTGIRLRSSFHAQHRFLKPEYLAKAKDFIQRRGLAGIFLGRFIGPLRSMTSVVAGMTSVPLTSFSFIALLGSFIFFTFHILLGYLAGNAWQSVEAWSSRAGALLLGTAVFIIFLWWLKNFLVKQGKSLLELAASFINSLYEALSLKAGSLAARCLNPKKFSGLPRLALLLAALFLIIATIFIGYSPDVLAGIDQRFSLLTSLFSDRRVAAAAFLLTILGSTTFIISLSVVAGFWLMLERRRSYIIGLLISVGGSLLSISILKFFIARPRPLPTFYFENFYAFPSLHAALALACFIFLSYYAIRAYPRWSRNVSLVLISTAAVLLIGLSRIYLGVHYVSDVIGGFCLSLAWFCLGVIAQRWLETSEAPRRLIKSRQIMLLVGIGLGLFSVYMSLAFDRGQMANFDYISKQSSRPIVDLLKDGSWPLVTENLRGGRTRPIAFIARAEENKLKNILLANGWTERQTPTLSSIADRSLSFILKKDLSTAPVRLRFWHNRPNDLSFTKPNYRDDKADLLILRLWRAALAESGEIVFVAELEAGQQDLINLLSSQENIILYELDL
jgi:undecaprenyl-diphosphatase